MEVALKRTFLQVQFQLDLLIVSPEEDVKAEHGEHDGQVSQDAHCIAQLVDQQEPLVDHPEKHGKVSSPVGL